MIIEQRDTRKHNSLDGDMLMNALVAELRRYCLVKLHWMIGLFIPIMTAGGASSPLQPAPRPAPPWGASCCPTFERLTYLETAGLPDWPAYLDDQWNRCLGDEQAR